ncbi:hypothetical protein [Longispora albida]|nr:hypothetical protein [Longispora albida]
MLPLATVTELQARYHPLTDAERASVLLADATAETAADEEYATLFLGEA